jgi:hypothetical protein
MAIFVCSSAVERVEHRNATVGYDIGLGPHRVENGQVELGNELQHSC